METKMLKLCAVLSTVLLGFTARANLITNITAYCRANNAATADLVKGEYYTTTYHADKAFDGDKTTNAGRLLLGNNTVPTPEAPFVVGYDISDDFMPGAKFVVNGFRFYRALNSDTIGRSITMIHLEASDNGIDGWTRLGGTESPVEIVWEKKHYSVLIPMEARRPSRHYRFVITGNNGATTYCTVCCAELELLGEIMEPEELTWNGGEGGTWDATSENWLDADGQASAWVGRGAAVLGSGSVTLSETAEVGEIRLGIGQTLSGGTLDFRRPGVIAARQGAVITSAIAEGRVLTDTIDSAAVGTRVFDDFPLQDAEKSGRQSVPTLLWTDRQVSEIVDFVGTGSPTYAHTKVGTLYTAIPMHVWANDSGMEFQLHAYPQDRLVFGEGFNLTQDGANVVLRAMYSRYAWENGTNGTFEHLKTYDFDFPKGNEGSWDGYVIDRDHSSKTYHYGARGPYLAVSALSSALTVKCSPGATVYSETDYLPGDSETHKTGVAVKFLQNALIGCIADFKGAQIRNYNSWYAAAPYHVVRTDDKVTVQFKCPYSTAMLCIKVEFTQDGPDVNARIVYAKYHYRLPEDYDCDIPSVGNLYENTVWDSAHGAGYGLKGIQLDYLESIRFDGAFAGNRDVTVADARMTLGASSLNLGQVFSGNGLLSFSPASGTQAVAFNGVCECGRGMELSGATTVTLNNAAAISAGTPLALKDGATLAIPAGAAVSAGPSTFSGTSTITLAAGATLALDAVAMADDAVVNLTVADGKVATAVRVGTTASVARNVLNHFRLNGKKINRQTEEGWLNPEDPGLILILR